MAESSQATARRSASPRATERRGSSSRPETASVPAAAAASSSAAGSRQLQVASGTAPPACDACRTRKVKCTPLDDTEQEIQSVLGSGIKCKLCVKRNEACTYEYVYKKPGRPVGSTKRSRKSASPTDTALSPTPARQRRRTTSSQPADPTQRPTSATDSSPANLPFYSNYTRLLDSRSNSPRFDYSIPTGPSSGRTNVEYTTADQPAALGAGSGSNRAGGLPPYTVTQGAHTASAGPATGTIFGSALSAMQSDNSFSDFFPNPFSIPAADHNGQAYQHIGLTADTMLGRSTQHTSNYYPAGEGLMPGIVVDLGPTLHAGGSGTWHSHDVGGDYGNDPAFSTGQSRPHRPWADQSTRAKRPDSAYPQASQHGSTAGAQAPSSMQLPGAPTPSANGAISDAPKVPHPATRSDIPQIESVAPWQDICFFLSLHMKHQHCLMPLVHKPSFAQDVLQRRDVGDEVFRGLLCSIVSYTICQLPIQLISHKYSRPELEMLLRRCQRTSRAIQLRWHMAPCLESLASLQLDTNTALGCTQLDLASALISDIRRQVYSLGLHKAEPREGLDFLQIQICRRLFWEIYQSDKTNVMNAISPISLNDLEGVPPLPLEIDDDYLTTTTSTPQPSGRISYMTGFVAVSRIFEILGQCQIRQRTWTNNPDAGPGRTELSRWVDDNQVKMRDILHDLPKALRAESGSREQGGFERADESSLGIQRANIHITALCVDWALLDFKVHLRPELDTKAEREQLARKAYQTLSSVPIEYLASNGESMRGKVLRIVLDLLSHCPEPGIFGQDVWNWWNMYSQVQFFQIIPQKENDETEARDPRPASSAGP